MKIEDLQVTAQLAHLNMEDAELAAAFPAFEQMLGFFAAMQAADNDDAAFPAGFADDAASLSAALIRPAGHFRPDGPNDNPNNPRIAGSTSANDEAFVSSLLNNAGDRDGRFIVVPNVL
ncbi:MAG: aspartyl/glutamyl-tRNA amidotransferase subunit C [Treponema sp.]|jgi:aspartyl-tRNA(Asn)/glutamyl-tRNA(Gln) amidotransferase subunit C|nr:aspartyl/glutamyl-tRNA amidotransferase subunit C [Treponema sp.]